MRRPVSGISVDIDNFPEAVAPERGDHGAEPPLADVEGGPPVVVESRVPVWHHHLRESHAVCDVPLGAVVIEGDLVDHRTFAEVEAQPY